VAVIRVRSTPPGADQYGDPIEGTVERVPIPGAFTAPRLSDEVDGRGRAGVVVGLTLYLPYSFDLQRTDRVEVDGVLYDVDGDVGRWQQPHTGWLAGATAALRRAEG
jgi:hypothetical protein